MTIGTPYLADSALLAIATGRAEDDPKLLLELGRASARFRRDARNHIYPPKSFTVSLNSRGQRIFNLPAAPITGPVIIEAEDGAVPVIIATGSAEGWRINRDTGELQAPGVIPEALAAITVTFTAGYEDIPDDIQDAICDAVARAMTHGAGIKQLSTGTESIVFDIPAGSTQGWADAVTAHSLNRGDQS